MICRLIRSSSLWAAERALYYFGLTAVLLLPLLYISARRLWRGIETDSSADEGRWWRPFAMLLAAMVLLGLGNAGQWSLNQVLLMGEIDDRYRGRAMSVYMMIFGVMPLAVMPAALVVDRIGPPPVIGALGVSLLVFSTLLLFTQRRIRRLP